MTVLKPVLSKIIGSVLSSVLGDITRFFTDFVSAGSMYISIPTATFVGDFEYSALIHPTDLSFKALFGSSVDAGQFCRISSPTVVRYQDANNNVDVTMSPALPSDIFYALSVGRSGTTLNVIATNSVGATISSGSATVNVSTLTIDLLFQHNSGQFFSGVGADVSLSGASFSSRFYPIKEDLSLGTTITDIISGQNGTAVAISSSDFYKLNAAGTIWLNQSGGSDLDIA